MDAIELNRLQQGQKLLGKISKLKAQIESMNDISHVNFISKKNNCNSPGRYYGEEPEIRVVNVDIPLNITDKIPHPFADLAAVFVHNLSMVLQNQVKELEKEFKNL